MSDLCSVSDVKEYLSITHTEDDVLIARLVAGASAWMETQCGRTFLASATNEIQYGEGGRVIVPYNYPLISVTTLVINDETIPVAPLSTDTGYHIIGDALHLRGYWIPADSVVSISYTAGFTSIPEDVRQATIETAAMRFRERDRVGQQSKSMGGESVVFTPYSVPASVQAVINSYRRIM